MNITKEQFNEYKEIQEMGAYNMLDPRARELTTLTKQEWVTILKNYDDLENKFETKRNFYSWYINPDNENEVIIYKQEKENENSYDCISHIIEQLLEENNNYTFHLN